MCFNIYLLDIILILDTEHNKLNFTIGQPDRKYNIQVLKLTFTFVLIEYLDVKTYLSTL